ncbi:MAG TPA: hypothetical protein PLS49_08280 [Candidatus Woesebacteria bacterium]|nr:hypothetical protein [Candidatus Woesebacteria bacterium]
MIAPDTQQNLLYTIYFMILHNYEAMFYLAGSVVMALWMLYRPSRAKFLIFLGFAILLFAFQYTKHIVDPLLEQTTNSLITERESWRIERYLTLLLGRVVPLFLPIVGWALIIAGGTIRYLKLEIKINEFINTYGTKKNSR